MSAFFGNMLISLKTGISATTLSAVANATTSSVTASVSGGRGTYTYSWVLSGVSCTITSPTAATTTFTGSSVTGNTSVYCAITDTTTGNTLITPTCTITWTAIPISQSVVISGGPVVYNGAARAYTLTGTPASPAPSGTPNPSTFVNAGTYTYPTNITSITPGSGYTLGSVTGNFVISPATISGTPTNTTLTFNNSQQSAVVITNVSPAAATYTGSLTASGTNAGTYTSSITGNGNYTGSVSGGTLTISRLPITNMSFTLNGVAFTTAQSRTAGTLYTIAVSSVTPSGATYSPTSLTASTAGTYSLTSSGTLNYTGSRTSPVLTITSPPAALSVSLPFIAGGGTTTQTMPTTITGGVPPYTLVSWVKNSGSGVFGATSVNSAVVNKQISVNTNFVCTVTIRDSVFTQASGSGTINWMIA
jgi:hypothetical protein